ncbi:MAG: RnfABCDGE type electron transport complex subunit G [Rikenellaceae bacterium]
MKSTLLNMVLSLFGITLIASAGVAGVYELTKEPIAAAKSAAVRESLTMVLPEFDKSEMESVTVDELPIDIYTASMGGEVVGYAVQSATKLGYSGLITMMVGVDPEGELLNVSVLSHNETPGLGGDIDNDNNSLIFSVQGKSLEAIDDLRVTKDGGDVDALTGATITSRAYIDVIKRAYSALSEQALVKKGGSNE